MLSNVRVQMCQPLGVDRASAAGFCSAERRDFSLCSGEPKPNDDGVCVAEDTAAPVPYQSLGGSTCYVEAATI